MSAQHTPGPWRDAGTMGAVVADSPVEGGASGADNVSYYGGHLIAESIAACNRPLIVAAPELLEELQALADSVDAWNRDVEAVIGRKPQTGMATANARAAIAKATGSATYG